MNKTVEARCADHIGEPFVRRCADCEAEQREADQEHASTPAPELGLRTPDEMREMRVTDVLRALRNEHRDRYMPEFTAGDWEAVARHLMAELNQLTATRSR